MHTHMQVTGSWELGVCVCARVRALVDVFPTHWPPYCGLPRDNLSDTTRSRDVGLRVTQSEESRPSP